MWLFDVHPDMADVKVLIPNDHQVILQHPLVVLAATGDPGKYPPLFGLDKTTQFTIGKNRITFKFNIINSDFFAFSDIKVDGSLIAWTHVHTTRYFYCIEALFLVHSTDGIFTLYQILRTQNPGNTQGKNATNFGTFKLF